MKQYHECALVKDGNRRVGYFISDTPTVRGQLDEWQLISAEQFEELVKYDKVQYLVYENGTIKCRYNAEEKEYLANLMKGAKKAQSFIEKSEKDYFNMDCAFKYEHITLAQQYNSIAAGAAGEVTSILGQKYVLLYFVGQQEALQSIRNQLICANPVMQNMVTVNNSVERVILPLKMLTDTFTRMVSYPLVNTSTLRYVHENKIDTPKAKLIQHNAKNDIVDDCIKALESITNNNLAFIKTRYNMG